MVAQTNSNHPDGLTFVTKCSDAEKAYKVWTLLMECGFKNGKYSEATIGEKNGEWRVVIAMMSASLPARSKDILVHWNQQAFQWIWLVTTKSTDIVLDLEQDTKTLEEKIKLAVAESIFEQAETTSQQRASDPFYKVLP